MILNRRNIGISSPRLVSTVTSTKDKTCLGRDAPTPKKKAIVVQYNMQANKAEMRSVTPENIQECLKDMGLNFSKYYKFEARRQKYQHMNMLRKLRKTK